MGSFEPYHYQADFSYDQKWDKYALRYAQQLQPDTLYLLHKQVLYDYIDHNILNNMPGKQLNILDVNCGTGNDFPYLLTKGTVTGIDGSAGMLNKAAETYSSAVEEGQLFLYKGMTEYLGSHSLDDRKFDLIYSITGGFSYINDEQFQQSFRVLKSMLTKNGVMVTAHLNTFCLSESIACLLRGRFKRSVLRLKKKIPTDDFGFMHLRNKNDLQRLLSPIFDHVEHFPLIALAPPYQTDVNFSPKTLQWLRKKEYNMLVKKRGLHWADQIVTVCH